MTKEELLSKSVAIVTMGCDKNTVDSERLAFKVQSAGFGITADVKSANIIIVNTCAFLQSARQENINKILELSTLKQNNLEKLIVCGCLPQKHYEEVVLSLPEVDLFLKLSENKNIVSHIFNLYNVKHSLKLEGKAPNRLISTLNHYAYLKVADGCNNFCSFCTIPLFRGRYNSTPIKTLLEEATALVKSGVKEIILVAQDVTKYGQDLEEKTTLVDLIQELSKIKKLKWIRLHYCYPQLITKELLQEIDNNSKVCKYLDIPFQHASTSVLKNMNRKDTTESLQQTVNNIKNLKNFVSIRSTFMCGFPGETLKDFKLTKQFLLNNKLNNVGFFAYSREEGTRSYTFKKQVPKFIKNLRVKSLQKIQSKIMMQNQAKFIDTKLEVIVDDVLENNTYIGRSQYQSPDVDTYTIFTSDKCLKLGEFVNVKITGVTKNFDLIGQAE